MIDIIFLYMRRDYANEFLVPFLAISKYPVVTETSSAFTNIQPLPLAGILQYIASPPYPVTSILAIVGAALLTFTHASISYTLPAKYATLYNYRTSIQRHWKPYPFRHSTILQFPYQIVIANSCRIHINAVQIECTRICSLTADAN